ncbi:MAG: hypothetical protein CML64_00545 [Rhodobacteraceae bacterium]|jgi:glyoxylase I family protein|nr:hypothetical protein [Paracoccaceae bacterium]|tara:strand:- start:7450 stop:7884 length:435 start_codon:yes stop_codon:yes gene_type:complete
MIKGIHHIGITALNINRLIKFYTEMFDAKIIKEGGWKRDDKKFNRSVGLSKTEVRIVMLSIGDTYIELFEFAKDAEEIPTKTILTKGFTHIAIEVENARKEYTRLEEAGMPFIEEPFLTPKGSTFAYGQDPEGNIIEIIQLPAP